MLGLVEGTSPLGALRGLASYGVMCQCLSFLAYPCPSISERWALWKHELQRLIARISSYNGPFTGLEVQHISIQGSLTTYKSPGGKVRVTLTMGTCMSSSSKAIDAATKQMALSARRKQTQHLQDRASSAPPLAAPSKRTRDKTRKDMRGVSDPLPSSTTEVNVPKKVCANGSSNFACLFSQQGRKGINQDAMIVWEDFGCQEDAVFCGVFDGHGPHGHLVAQIVRDSLPPKLASIFQTIKKTSAEMAQAEAVNDEVKEGSAKGMDGSQVSSNSQALWKDSFLNAYMLMDRELQVKAANIDCFCSGTTAVTLIKQGNDVILGNVGDSRAILGTKSDDGSLIAVPLTVDLKPNLPKEAERIRQCRGRVFALQDEPEVHRVWLPHDNSPGLAMARAFGDFCLKNYGVISVPEVTHRRLTDKDQFIVLATDGIWDVLSNKEVVDIVSSVPSKSLAARAVVEMAVHSWRSKFPTSKVDDCAVVCLFIKEIVAFPPGRNIKKTTPRKRTTSALFQKPSLVGISNRDRPSEVLQQQVSSNIKSGVSSRSQSHSERNGKTEVGNPSQAMVDVESSQMLSHESLGNGERMSKQDSSFGNDVIDNTPLYGVVHEEEWSALDGVTRVNSLVNLPRFTPGDWRAGG